MEHDRSRVAACSGVRSLCGSAINSYLLCNLSVLSRRLKFALTYPTKNLRTMALRRSGGEKCKCI